MSARARFEIVRTDAGWHARYVAGNNEIVMQQEPVTRRRTAVNGVRSLARTFHPRAAVIWVEGDYVHVTYVTESVVRIRLVDVDERPTDLTGWREPTDRSRLAGVTGAQPDEPASQVGRPVAGGGS